MVTSTKELKTWKVIGKFSNRESQRKAFSRSELRKTLAEELETTIDDITRRFSIQEVKVKIKAIPWTLL